MAISNQELQAVRSQGSITLAVSATGSDAPSANRPFKITSGNYSAYPFATIQAAIDSLPRNIRKEHTLTINVGAGTFGGFDVAGFVFGTQTMFMNGTRAVFTPTTGPSSGTATSGGDGTITLADASWTTGNLVGKFLNITAGSGVGYIIPIESNTTDTIVVSHDISLDDTTEFTIEDVVTIIDTLAATGVAGIVINNNGSFVLSDFKVEHTTPHTYGIHVAAGGGLIRRCVCSQYTGFNIEASLASCQFCIADGSSYAGYFACCVGSFAAIGSLAVNCLQGLWVEGINTAVLQDVHVIGCATGFVIIASRVNMTSVVASNCSTISFDLDSGANIRVNTSLSGSGNFGFGLNIVGAGNIVELLCTPTITGYTGEVTVDSSNDETWAFLSTIGNAAVNANTGSIITRISYPGAD